MSSSPWLGRDEHGGVPSQVRPDCSSPPHWRLDAIYATARPHHPVVSPAGDQIAFILSAEATSDIYTVAVDGGQAKRLTTNRKLASFWEDTAPKWSPDGSLVAYTSGDDTFVVDADGGPPRRLPGVGIGHWLSETQLVVIVDRKRTTRLALVDIEDPWPQPFGPHGGDVGQVALTDEGKVVATFWPRHDFNRSDIFVASPDGDWSTLVGHDDRRALDAAVSGNRVAYALEDGDWRAVYTTDLDGGAHELLAKDDADFSDLAWSPDGSRLTAIRSRRGQADLVTIEIDGSVETVEIGGFWQTPTWAGESLVAVHEAHDTAPRLILVGSDGPTVLFDGAPAAVSNAPHRPFERVTFTTSDGVDVEGFLFEPEDTSQPVPAVVYPHGGPTSVYGDEWDGHAQYFIDKGYAWFAINFRGSTTYGLGLERANHNDWGVGDTRDCIEAGKYLQGLEWVDGDRLSIFGASYGSYLALTSLAHPENPFACGVAKYGDSNILTSWAQGDRPGSDDLERMMGHPTTNRSGYRAGSPIHDIEEIDKPILIAHGEKDARVHLKQAEELVAELKRLGKRYEYVTYPDEAHGFLRRESQIDFYKRLEKFLDWHLL